MFICSKCGEERAVDDFTGTQSEELVCTYCKAGADGKKAESLARKKITSAMSGLISLKGDNATGSIGTVRNILGTIYGEFGGPDGFGKQIAMFIRKAAAAKNPSPSIGKLMLDVIKLHQRVEQDDAAKDARELTDAQLRDEMQLELTKMLFDAVGDPAKRGLVEQVFAAQGLKLDPMSRAEMLEEIGRTEVTGVQAWAGGSVTAEMKESLDVEADSGTSDGARSPGEGTSQGVPAVPKSGESPPVDNV